MRYFAMIDGEQRGPFLLEELPDAGVRPETYVWCKGMDDWMRADEVADICRLYRQRIFDMMHGGLKPVANSTPVSTDKDTDSADENDPYSDVPLRFRGIMRRSGIDPESFRVKEPETDTSRPPYPTLFLSLMVTLFCSMTGLVAVYYSFKARKSWQESDRNGATGSKDLYTREERERLRREAHEYSRKAKMWLGISFFIGIIVTALIGSRMI